IYTLYRPSGTVVKKLMAFSRMRSAGIVSQQRTNVIGNAIKKFIATPFWSIIRVALWKRGQAAHSGDRQAAQLLHCVSVHRSPGPAIARAAPQPAPDWSRFRLLAWIAQSSDRLWHE